MGYDVAIVGAGILGLAHAYMALRRGKSVVVIERDHRANGASVRNFGLITVTGQQAGSCWLTARRSREIWADIIADAGLEVIQSGLIVAARLSESGAVIDAFLETEMGRECVRLTHDVARKHVPALRPDVHACLYSPHEVRIESRDALPRLAAWLAEKGVMFRWATEALEVVDQGIRTARGLVEAETVILCAGDQFNGPLAALTGDLGLGRCKLQMLRVRPAEPVRFNTAIMSDLGLGRYLGYAELEAARPLIERLNAERAEARTAGVHLIAVQSADGSLIVGDSHDYADTPDPFSDEVVDTLILDELDGVLDLGNRTVTQRWTGTYASHPDTWLVTGAPRDNVRFAVVSSGTGASTAPAIAEQTLADLFD